MRLLFTSFTIIFATSICFGLNNFENEYDIRNIPPELLIDAGAVIRTSEQVIEIKDIDEAVYSVKFAVTIFNKDKQDIGVLKLLYDNFRTIEELEGKIYDAEGEVIRELENEDTKDFSDYESFSLYNDNRIRLAFLFYDRFPYTVEFKYKIEFDGILNLPDWYSRNTLNPVEKSSFKVIFPDDYNLRYWCNEDVEPVVSKDGGDITYYWEANNLPQLSNDVYIEDIEDVATIVYIAPSEFEIDGYDGRMKSWRDFGGWYYRLSKGRDELPETAVQEIHEQIGPDLSVEDKIEKLYEYLQSTTRYVSVQLGIGSWQPYDASYVFKNGYGDCKALSNYMVAILKEAGITAYPVLIQTGDKRLPLIEEFPSNQFNHAVVAVPLEKDTIWLECTSQVLPAGQIGWSNENRKALMVTSDGGKIVNTPTSISDENLQLKNLSVKLSSRGTADVRSEIKWEGNQNNYVIHVVEKTSHEEKEKWIRNLMEVPDLKLTNYGFNIADNIHRDVDLQFEITIPRYASISGKRIFFNPNLIERRTSVPSEVEKRLSPIRFNYPYLDIDSIKYQIPENYKIEAMPDEVNIESSFGNFYSKTVINEDHTISFLRKLEIKDYSIPAENYDEYRTFFADVVKADKQQVVLVESGK